MRDLTQGSIRGHLVAMALPITIGMLVQTLYLMVDLYFVSALGKQSVAGVAAAGNVTLLVIALTQVLGVGTVSLVARALGARDPARASRVFEQAMLLGLACMATTLVLGVVGSILGGGLTHMISRARNERYHPAGLIFSTLGAILVLFVCYKLKIHLP